MQLSLTELFLLTFSCMGFGVIMGYGFEKYPSVFWIISIGTFLSFAALHAINISKIDQEAKNV